MGVPSGRFDGHAHVFHKSLPMVQKQRYFPKENAYLDCYIELLKEHQLDGALLVQPSFLGTDNTYLLSNIITANSITEYKFRGVVAVQPDISFTALREMNQHGIVGIRFNLIGQPTPDFQSAEWLGLFEKVNLLGWFVELHIEGTRLSGLLPYLLTLCETVVIDHFGLPDADAPLDCPGFRAILDSADRNLFVKTSAPFRVFPGNDSKEAAAKTRTIYQHLWDALGPDKLVWGSDWPWTMFENRHDFAETMNWLPASSSADLSEQASRLNVYLEA